MSIERGLKKRVEEWVGAGLITPEQAERIYAHEADDSARNTLGFALAWLATGCIGLGIIALIASNWDAIPAAAKLILYFAVYAGLAAALLHPKTDRGHWREMIRLALMIFTMAGLGLVAQIYNIHSEPWRGPLFWCLMTLPLAITATSPLGVLLWYPIFLFTYFNYGASQDSVWFWENRISGVWLFSITGILSTLMPNRWPELRYFRRIAGFASILAAMIFPSEGPPLNHLLLASAGAPSFYLATSLGLLAWAVSVLIQRQAYPPGTRYGFAAFCAIGIFTALFMIVASLKGFDHRLLLEFLYGILFTFGALALAVAAYAAGRHRTCEWLCIIVFLRWLMIYGHTMMSLAMNGFGLISIGILILVFLTQWKRIRPKLYQAIEERIHDAE